jgi:hypothetical protein
MQDLENAPLSITKYEQETFLPYYTDQGKKFQFQSLDSSD